MARLESLAPDPGMDRSWLRDLVAVGGEGDHSQERTASDGCIVSAGGEQDGRAEAWPYRYDRGKIVFDRVLGILLFALSLPVILVAMVLVRLTSRGPAIYCQRRVGLGGRPFTIYKLRTMQHDCERKTGPRWATTEDPRVTAIGRFLRRTHLDELPQLWNVVMGEMSLVGPRPERPEIVAELERVIPRYRDRQRVLPGVTGLAQVQLPPDTDINSVRRKLACDLAYIERRDFHLDLKIVLATALLMAGVPCRVSCAWLRISTGEGVMGSRDVSVAELVVKSES